VERWKQKNRETEYGSFVLFTSDSCAGTGFKFGMNQWSFSKEQNRPIAQQMQRHGPWDISNIVSTSMHGL
jgi:hypothetical protein